MKRFALAVLVLLTFSALTAPAQEDNSLYALGAVGASNLYFSYLVLGTVADSYASDGYTAGMARQLASEAIALNTSSRDALQKLLNEKSLSADDQQVLNAMIEAHTLLISQAQGLLKFVDDPSQTTDFQNYREQAWAKISKLLGIEK